MKRGIQTPEFRERQGLKLFDLPQDEKMYPKPFAVRLPQDVAEKLLHSDGTKNTALIRRILVEVIRNHPNFFEDIKQGLAESQST
ncbi:hypothetical protein [Picosynechococcus sp. NKBG15041c]|uniref:hypothetical protein n=1 Tax=Picosynechococcus sp. NKBG15041c TaxID=1407650 RepID=UPI0004183EFA|nr:hypothetical protein [Picosynechococcus sp. NKBG15041c]